MTASSPVTAVKQSSAGGCEKLLCEDSASHTMRQSQRKYNTERETQHNGGHEAVHQRYSEGVSRTKKTELEYLFQAEVFTPSPKLTSTQALL
jgi:hypothetical protein